MDIISYLKEKYNAIEKPVDEEKITSAESSLGLVFSSEYKSILQEFGQVSVDEHDFTGISETPLFDVVAQTKMLRDKYSDIPNNIYVFEDIGMDGIILCQDGDGILYACQKTGSPVRVADSILEYLKKYNEN